MKSIYIILVVAFLIRLIPLGQSLWLDEAINIIAARDRNPIDLVTNYALADYHPPFYHLVLHYWIKLHGADEVSARFPSVIFGVITIFFCYKLSQLIFKEKRLLFYFVKVRFNLLPSILLAISGLHIYYSGEARMYSLATMAFSGALYYATKLVGLRTGQHRLLSLDIHRHLLELQKYVSFNLFFVLWLVMAIYTDYVVWLSIPVFLVVLPIPTLVALGTLLPWIPYFYKQLIIGLNLASDYPAWSSVVGGFSVKNLVLVPVKFLIGRVSIDDSILYGLFLSVPMLAITYLFFISFSNKNKTRATQLLWFAVVSSLVLGVGLSLKISLLSYFRFLFLLPSFYIVLVYGMSYLSPRLTNPILTVLLATTVISSTAYLYLPKFHRENWRYLVNWINDTSSSYLSGATVIPSLAQGEPYYYYKPKVMLYQSLADFEQPPQVVYLIRYLQEIFDPNDSLRLALENEGYTKIQEHSFNGVVVWMYTRTNKVYAFISNNQ